MQYYNQRKQVIGFCILLITAMACSCNRNPYSAIKVQPGNFKFSTLFLTATQGILVNTYWGPKKKRHVLLVDNFSPSWIKQSVADSDPSLLAKSDFHFNTQTASGRPAAGPVGICNSLIFGNVIFEQCPFYVMKDEATPSVFDGVLGSELMNKGIWEINFSNDELIFTSSIDSLPDAASCEPLQASFQENSITLNVKFSNGPTKRMFVDLGFNQGMMLPQKDYKDIGKKNVFILSDAKFTTASDSQHVTAFATVDTVKIGNNRFVTSVLAAENNKESLIGLQFFKRFKFIILDFKNKKLLIPKVIR